MGYIYKDNSLIGSVDEAGKILKDNKVVGFAKKGLIYNQYQLFIGSYRDNQVFDYNGLSIGSVNPKGQVQQNGKIVGDVASCSDQNLAAGALLLLLSYTPAYLFNNNIMDENNLGLLKEFTYNLNSNLKNCLAILEETPNDDSNPIHFKRISKKIDIFMDEKWEEFLSIAATNSELFTRLLKVYPDLLKHLAKQSEFEKDNHYINFTMAVLAFNGEFVERNTTYAIQTLFKSAKESYELAIKICQLVFTNTNIIDSLNSPMQSVYTIQLSKQEVYEMIEYLERTFPIKATPLPTTKISIRNKFQSDDIDGLAIDKITYVNDIIYSDSWLNIIACLITANYDIANKITTIVSSLPEAIYNAVKVENTNNPYILYIYGIFNMIGIKTKENHNEGLKYIKFSADSGYDLAIAYINNTSVNDAFNSSSFMRQVKISSNREAINSLSLEIIDYLSNRVAGGNKTINLYSGIVIPQASEEPVIKGKAQKQKANKAKAAKAKAKDDDEKKSSKGIVIFVFVLLIICVAAAVIVNLTNK